MAFKWIFKGLLTLLLCFSPLCQAQNNDILLLKTYHKSQDVKGWLMSEKLDGIRAIWDGKTLTTRKGNPITAPDWFIKGLPPFAIDGELWTRRNNFETISSIVRTQTPDKRWKNISYNIFEVPNDPAQNNGLLARLSVLETFLTEHPSQFLKVIPQITIDSPKHLQVELSKVIALGGEGLVVRRPAIPYQTGRSNSALKVKQYQDTECTVIGYKSGKGKYEGHTGAIKCQLPSGLTFFIGSGLSDQQRQHPPEIDSIITFKYYGLTKNKLPRFPVFMRERPVE
jgi:DNA ligase-1